MRRDTLPTDWQSALLRLLLQTLSFSLSPSNPRTHQAGNGIVVRKLFGSVCPSLGFSWALLSSHLRLFRMKHTVANDQAGITSPPYTSAPIPKSPHNSHQLDPIVNSCFRTSSRISPRVGL